jgi:hypothetical protein
LLMQNACEGIRTVAFAIKRHDAKDF